MQHRVLGQSGLLVSPICLGTMTFGEPVGEEDAIRLTHESIELGINFIDTANAYEGYRRVIGSAGGWAEQIVGKALQGRRDDVVLATKVGAPLGPGPQDRGLSASTLLRHLDDSLQRLQTDYIDVYITHWPDKYVPLETTHAAMDIAVRQGKVRYFGTSNLAAWQMCEYLWQADRHGWPRVVSSQIPFSLLHREFEQDLVFCEKYDVAVTPYQSLQGGLLTGKYKRGQSPPADSRAAEKPQWVAIPDDATFDKLEAFEQLAAEAGMSPARYSLAWALTRRAMASLIVGAKRVEQVKDAIAAAETVFPVDHFEKLDAIFPPSWIQPDPLRG